MKLTDFKVLTFDCYGTLIDWESGIHNALKPLIDLWWQVFEGGAIPDDLPSPFAGAALDR